MIKMKFFAAAYLKLVDS